MCGQVIGDDMDLLACGLRDHEIGQKRHKLFRGMPRRYLPQQFARLNIEGRVQGQGAMAIVFKLARKWQTEIK